MKDRNGDDVYEGDWVAMHSCIKANFYLPKRGGYVISFVDYRGIPGIVIDQVNDEGQLVVIPAQGAYLMRGCGKTFEELMESVC